jgi:hypothetical protein
MRETLRLIESLCPNATYTIENIESGVLWSG